MIRKVFRKLVSVEEAKRRFYQHFTSHPTDVEIISLIESYRRVLGEDVEAQIDVYPFDRAIARVARAV